MARPFATRPFRSWRRRTRATHEPKHGRNDEQEQRNEEDDLRNLDGDAGDATEAKHGSDQGDDEKRDSPTEHGRPLSIQVHRFVGRSNVEVEKMFRSTGHAEPEPPFRIKRLT
jgi:hypothetical protein